MTACWVELPSDVWLTDPSKGLFLAGKRPLAGRDASNLGLFSHIKNIVDLDA
jgi:hypothetical protein